MATQRMTGIEAMQLHAMADALLGVHPEAVVSLTRTEDGLMHVQVDHPDNGVPKTTWATIDIDATVLPGLVSIVDLGLRYRWTWMAGEW
jgi:hypothetical protein